MATRKMSSTPSDEMSMPAARTAAQPNSAKKKTSEMMEGGPSSPRTGSFKKSAAKPKSSMIIESDYPPARETIAFRAWEIWQSSGCPEGKALEHWLQAEQELLSE